jgi:hypoxanthine phosphoribosyltransferase
MPESDSPPVHSVSWQDFDALIQALASQLRAGEIIPDSIIGIARGGCVVAVTLSHLFPSAEFCVIEARTHRSDAVRAEKQPVSVQTLAGALEFKGRKVLLVDDALHTGATAQACHDFVKRFEPDAIWFAALLQDTYGIEEPILPLSFQFFIADQVNAWIVFPWEPRTEK